MKTKRPLEVGDAIEQRGLVRRDVEGDPKILVEMGWRKAEVVAFADEPDEHGKPCYRVALIRWYDPNDNDIIAGWYALAQAEWSSEIWRYTGPTG